MLKFDGEGRWKLENMSDTLDDRLSLADEKTKLQCQLADVPKLKERLVEICAVFSTTPKTFIKLLVIQKTGLDFGRRRRNFR